MHDVSTSSAAGKFLHRHLLLHCIVQLACWSAAAIVKRAKPSSGGMPSASICAICLCPLIVILALLFEVLCCLLQVNDAVQDLRGKWDQMRITQEDALLGIHALCG